LGKKLPSVRPHTIDRAFFGFSMLACKLSPSLPFGSNVATDLNWFWIVLRFECVELGSGFRDFGNGQGPLEPSNGICLIAQALHYLGEITGTVTADDLLENIFSKFCIGK
jgi:hypothetical protein